MTESLTIYELCDSGDWASAHGDAWVLVDVCSRLAPLLAGELARLAEVVAATSEATGGMAEASLVWEQLSRALRREARRSG